MLRHPPALQIPQLTGYNQGSHALNVSTKDCRACGGLTVRFLQLQANAWYLVA